MEEEMAKAEIEQEAVPAAEVLRDALQRADRVLKQLPRSARVAASIGLIAFVSTASQAKEWSAIESPAVSPAEGKSTTLEISATQIPPAPEIKIKKVEDFERFRVQVEAPKTSIVPPEETPGEKKAVIIKNETGLAEILIDQEILNLMENEIKNSGLSRLIRMVVIRNMRDEVFKFPSDYGEVISEKGFKKPLAVIVGLGSPEGPTIFLSNEPAMTKGLVLHELGHVADPYRNRNIGFAIPEFEENYFKNHYLKYFGSIPRGELEPYLSADEKQIVVGRTLGLGGDLWEVFLNKLPNPVENIEGATHWYIPDEKLRELADKLPSWSIQKMAVEWRIKELEKLEKEGRRLDFNGFESQTWGTFLLREYYKDPERFKKVWPDLYPMVKKTAEETFIPCRTEMWAELWRKRVLDREEAVKIYSEGVVAQERVIEYLRENQVDN